MTDKIGQIKKILEECFGTNYTGDDEVADKIAALYSPEPEKVVCPKPCELEGCSHRTKHNHNNDCDIPCRDAGFRNEGCVPVPTDELLTEIEKLSNAFYNKYSGNGLTPSEVMELHKSEYWENITKLILAKCRQSKAAIRADERKKIANLMMAHVKAESGLPPRWVADLISKLQEGEEVK
jgi:hypothetical protein